MSLLSRVRRTVQRVRQLLPAHSRPTTHAARREVWERRWRSPDHSAKWLGRGVSPEIVAAVEDGWFPAGKAVLDVGCGTGVIAHWFAERGHVACGTDIAETVVEQARTASKDSHGRLEYITSDICTEVPPNGPYSIIIDRGCFHCIPEELLRSYTENLVAASAPDARMLLFLKAFREEGTIEAQEREEKKARVQSAFAGRFAIERIEDTFLDPFDGKRPGHVLRGMVFWLRR